MDKMDKMDKRKHFQIQLLTNKLAEYTKKLETLKLKQSELIKQTLDTPLDDKSKLLEQKQILEARIQEYKNNLSNCRSEYSRLNNNKKLLPGLLETTKKQELDIYNEEIQNIAGRIQETKQEHLDNLASLKVEKSKLSLQIQDLQNQLDTAQQNISSIQESAHAYRKNTILELQQKKQQKIIITTTLEGLNKTKDIYNNNNIDVSSRLDKLINLKVQIIDAYYGNSGNSGNSADLDILNTPNARELLPKEILSTPYSANSTELLNVIILYLDNQIQDARYQLSSILKKTDRLDKSINTTIINLKEKQKPTSRDKVISYKDNYKNAKLEKTLLEERLTILQAKLNSWDINILDNVKLEYQLVLDSLEAEKQRAKERLDIMTSRIIQENENNSIALENELKQLELKVISTNNLLKQTNQELTTLLGDIAKNYSTNIELDNINTQIISVEVAIEKINLDIFSLSS
jgi:chromosome segregation ATPase